MSDFFKNYWLIIILLIFAVVSCIANWEEWEALFKKKEDHINLETPFEQTRRSPQNGIFIGYQSMRSVKTGQNNVIIFEDESLPPSQAGIYGSR